MRLRGIRSTIQGSTPARIIIITSGAKRVSWNLVKFIAKRSVLSCGPSTAPRYCAPDTLELHTCGFEVERSSPYSDNPFCKLRIPNVYPVICALKSEPWRKHNVCQTIYSSFVSCLTPAPIVQTNPFTVIVRWRQAPILKFKAIKALPYSQVSSCTWGVPSCNSIPGK